MKERKEYVNFTDTKLPRDTIGSELEKIIRAAAKKNGYRVTTIRRYDNEKTIKGGEVTTKTSYISTTANVTGFFTALSIRYDDIREGEKHASYLSGSQSKISIENNGRDIRSLFTTEKKKWEFLEAIAQEYEQFDQKP